jgi:hypothetical protein
MVCSISPSGKVAFIDGASDIELDYNTASNTKSWANGFNSSNTIYAHLYNYGDNAGDYDHGSTTYSNLRNNGWTTDDVYQVSWGIVCCQAVPEIYYSSQANQWYHVALYGVTHYNSFYMCGVMSENGASGSLSADSSYTALINQLAQDSRTAQATIDSPTII